MSEPSAKIICDSISPTGVRLTTMEIKMHRIVLAEFNTHRVFSRNSASSRAIPVQKQLEKVKTDPALPVYWGKNQAGMSANEELTPEEIEIVKRIWLDGRDNAIKTVELLQQHNLHKQLSNRLLEPWMWHTAIVSSTEWSNAFAQRCHKDAQPEIRAAFMAAQKAYYTSTPKDVCYGGWHTPYIDSETIDEVYKIIPESIKDKYNETLNFIRTTVNKISVARCARVSYLTHDGKRDIQEDIKMFDKLVSASPMHASPLEHVATPVSIFSKGGNFREWDQYRYEFPNQNITTFTPNHPDLI